MLTNALIAFAIAAVGGLTMAVMHFRGRPLPHPVIAAVHGLLAASGLVMLLIVVLRTGVSGGPGLALGLFLLAALGGFALLGFHLRGRRLPGGLVVGHGLLAVIAFVTLLVAGLAIRA